MLLSRFFYITLSFTLITLFTLYIARPIKNYHRGGRDQKIKKIVAYSLLKQIEIESETFACQNIRDVRAKNYHPNVNESEKTWTRVPGTEFYIYSIYYDRRLNPFHYLRIIGMIKGTNNQSVFCQMKTSKNNYAITKATQTNIWSKSWNKNDNGSYYNPVLLSCQIPHKKQHLKVHLSPNPCEIVSKGFLVKFPTSSNQSLITVCVKPLDFFDDISRRLVQWIEINRILGADGFEIYVKKIHEKTWKVLEWYQKNLKNFRLMRHSNIVDYDSNKVKKIWQKRRNEIVPYNDCLYRNLYASQFIIPVDTDEIIVPRRVYTWNHLLNGVFSSGDRLMDEFASFTVQNAYYLREFTRNLDKEVKYDRREKDMVFFLEDLTRSELSVEGESGKSFISTSGALTVFNHYALHVLKPGIYRSHFLSPDIVQMNHYKNTCSIELLPECAKYLSSPVRILDTVIMKYRKHFNENYRKIIRCMKEDDVFL